MQCEVCGGQIFGAPFRAVIEGVNMTVCPRCSKLGSGYWEPKPQQRSKPSINRKPIQHFPTRKPPTTMPESLELVNNFGQLVRQAREGLGMSHKDLGGKIRERVSVLRKIEMGKMVPDLGLAERLEHTLKIKLRVPPTDPKAQISSSSKPRGTTLGDLIKFKLKNEEEEN
ncbi:multiprotein bridging factor aMBF1 [Thermoproteota archaeon]